jgi:hypothetical protein
MTSDLSVVLLTVLNDAGYSKVLRWLISRLGSIQDKHVLKDRVFVPIDGTLPSSLLRLLQLATQESLPVTFITLNALSSPIVSAYG